MKEETRQILEIITQIQETMATKDDINKLDAKIENVRSELNAKIESVRVETMGELSRVERSLYNEISSVHKDLSSRLDNHDGFSKEIDHTIGRVKFIEDHLELQTA